MFSLFRKPTEATFNPSRLRDKRNIPLFLNIFMVVWSGVWVGLDLKNDGSQLDNWTLWIQTFALCIFVGSLLTEIRLFGYRVLKNLLEEIKKSEEKGKEGKSI